ncbi:MAG: hypothetical protein DWQ31_02145 [Planctomycetota bacterium]|nr:MAG: hypothetical protein DWQ31_02145 [Planctomycetota bacterium]REJ95387.1 MAG: hypothetical protein DWQ35_06570 [Planctomycetota bacterium]REK17587.1 MAG: hypothetical protein DWQ42_22280 [Planctomycetota bacterium]REK39822.1 MAG: hypothetical protein DWQ46_17450 [Planctomycetota bacterium]
MAPKKIQAVSVGNWVKIHDLDDDEEEVFYLVEEAAAEPARSRISTHSPFAQAVMGSKPGQVVSFPTPGGKSTVKIVDTGKEQPR